MARVPEVLVVDQDPKARFEIKQLVKHGQFNVAGEAALGTEAVSLAAELKPDVIICGIGTPAERSLQTIEALLDVLSETPLIAYSWQADLETVRQAMLAGARDFLVMAEDGERVRDSIMAVLESEERKRLRQTGQARSLGPRGLVITVFGAKGGVGKTTIATNLGVALGAELGQSAVLIDADTGFGDAAAMLDLKPDRSIMDLLQSLDRVDRENLADYLLVHDSGLYVLPAPRESLLWRSVPAERFRRLIDVLARRFDIVLVDTAAALTDITLAALEESNVVLWVTSTDFSSINSSLQGLETLRQLALPEARIRLMLNVISVEDGVRPERIEQALGWQFFWLVPHDRQLRLGTQVGRPAVLVKPASPAARSLVELAHALVGNGHKPKPRPSLLKRLLAKPQASAMATANSGR